jgi:hypothetical protein
MATDEDKKKSKRGPRGGIGPTQPSPLNKEPSNSEATKGMSPGEMKARVGSTTKSKRNNKYVKKQKEKEAIFDRNKNKKFPKTNNNNNDGSPNKKFKKEKGDSLKPPSEINKKTPTGTVNPSQSKDTRTLKEKILETRVANALKRKKRDLQNKGEKVLGVLGLEIKKKNRGGLMRKPKLAKRGF